MHGLQLILLTVHGFVHLRMSICLQVILMTFSKRKQIILTEENDKKHEVEGASKDFQVIENVIQECYTT
jgi:hypothetical protein